MRGDIISYVCTFLVHRLAVLSVSERIISIMARAFKLWFAEKVVTGLRSSNTSPASGFTVTFNEETLQD